MRSSHFLFTLTAAATLIVLPVVAANSPSTTTTLNRLPLRFEQNQGQTSSQVRYFARAKRHVAFFSDKGVVLRLDGARQDAATVRMTFENASKATEISGEAPLEGTTNYLLGQDSSKWKTGISSFARVRYHEVYPGIDVVFYGNDKHLEYDLVVRPGANLSKVDISVEGAAIGRTREGGLMMKTAVGELRQGRASVYQVIDGKRVTIPVRYQIAGKHIRFLTGPYDRSRELVVDPVMQYSTLLGGTDSDAAYKVAVDADGYAYVTGATESTDFPTTTGAYRRTCVGQFACSEAFVTKINRGGTGIVYSTFIGGSSTDAGEAIALDAAKNAYITGTTNSSDFPGTVIGPAASPSLMVFVAKLNPTGSGLVYGTRFGEGQGVAIDVDSNGFAYVTGFTQSSTFPTTTGAFQTTGAVNGDYDSFISKLSQNGSSLVYSTYLGGTGSDFTHSITVDSAGSAYVAGETAAANFPTTPGAYQTTNGGPAGSYSGFAVKMNSGGTALVYSTYLGGSGSDSATGIAIDGSGNAYVTGATASPDFPTTSGVVQRTRRGSSDAFVTKLNASGSALVYSSLLGGGGEDGGWAIAVNSSGFAYVLGSTFSSDFPTTDYGFDRVFGGGGCGDSGTSPCPDAFVAEFTPSGTGLAFSSFLGGNGQEVIGGGSEVGGIALGPNGTVFVAGSTNSLNFPTTNTAYKQSFRDSQDGFVVKLISTCSLGSTTPSVTICKPGSGTSVSSPVTIIAGTRSAKAVKLLQVYVDGVKKYEAPLSAIDLKLSVAKGTHRLTVQGYDTSNTKIAKTIYFTVN